YLAGGASDRKLRLFACACCRRLPGYLESEPDRQGLELTERDVDGQAQPGEFDKIGEEGWDIRWDRREPGGGIDCAVESLWGEVWGSRQLHAASKEEQGRAREEFEAELASLVREIVGNPFRTVTIDPRWLRWNDGVVLRLAQEMYDSRAFDRMP